MPRDVSRDRLHAQRGCVPTFAARAPIRAQAPLNPALPNKQRAQRRRERIACRPEQLAQPAVAVKADASDHHGRTNRSRTNFASTSTEFEHFAENDFRAVIQVAGAMHRVGIFERAAIAFRIVLRAIVAREHELETARFVAKPIIDTVDHAGSRIAQSVATSPQRTALAARANETRKSLDMARLREQLDRLEVREGKPSTHERA